MSWEQNHSYLYFSNHTEKLHRKYACFDLDDTIITTKSHKKFPIDKNDWKFNFSQIPEIIQELQQKRYNIVIITNQAGIGKKENNSGISDWQDKLNDIIEKLNVPIIIYVSLIHDYHRKPFPTFWKMLTANKKVNLKKSFYCGDACGRKTDFSDSDLKFALNCHINFVTPEHLFNHNENINTSISYPVNFDKLQQITNFQFTPQNKEMIIMVGIPGSGKSSFVKKFIKPQNYEIINRDTFKTMPLCLSECTKYLKSGKSVVIDNTNPSIEAREKFISLAKQNNYTCRCFIMNTDINLAKHNALYRHYVSKGEISLIPEIVYNKYRKNYEAPNKEEGFESIIEVDFIFDDSYVNKEDYHLYFLTK